MLAFLTSIKEDSLQEVLFCVIYRQMDEDYSD